MRFKQVAVAVALVLATLATQGEVKADYLWLQMEGPQARVYAGELLKPLGQLPAFTDAQVVNPEGQRSAIQKAADHFTFDAGGSGDTRFCATLPSTNGVLTYHYARFGRQEIKPVHDLELVPVEPGGDTFRLFFKGQPVTASQVHVSTSEGWRRVLHPGKDGTVNFKPWFPGLYVLEVTARVNNGSVTLDGKKFDDVRHSATLSFEVRY